MCVGGEGVLQPVQPPRKPRLLVLMVNQQAVLIRLASQISYFIRHQFELVDHVITLPAHQACTPVLIVDSGRQQQRLSNQSQAFLGRRVGEGGPAWSWAPPGTINMVTEQINQERRTHTVVQRLQFPVAPAGGGRIQVNPHGALRLPLLLHHHWPTARRRWGRKWVFNNRITSPPTRSGNPRPTPPTGAPHDGGGGGSCSHGFIMLADVGLSDRGRDPQSPED